MVQNARLTDTITKGLAYRENTHINIQSVKVASATNTPSPTQTLAKWPTIRIRLSYTGSTIRLKSGDTTLPRLSLGTKLSGTLRKNLELPFEAYGSDKVALVIGGKKYPFEKVALSAKLVAIPNWNRKPAWDTSGMYNDNIFRGKITVINEGGKLLVINELPLEDYLRGLAEVSNTDNEEKIKTILTAARSYAYFYTKPANRKFPGKPYDGSDNPDEFQKYLGYGYEQRSPLAGQLVDMTNGQLVTYHGDPIKVWYFNESNGRTLSYKEYCQARVTNGTLSKTTVCEDIPYFQSVSDPGGVGHTQKWHGVGISGIGATYLATQLNFKYTQIIEYYLEGVKVEKKY
ncbi:MAG: hypothetical protein ACD_78C00169G0001 [uncultured bacterium (gcode 4)]|uniref:Sporulation stage II protein D amidase enhancer LytB N-terminal domain-containing protein n=1 Tax=uncultured bacterium (gcode 4) TaxID=1234023 RepID=K1XYK0_9BACT|nr:MAG: hypothetical protein ACD_78C00169G0001 [uncultured bacterium (gcode 4)]